MKTRVFIVEDELIHAEALKIALEEAGLELAGECNNADSAFDKIAPYSLIASKPATGSKYCGYIGARVGIRF